MYVSICIALILPYYAKALGLTEEQITRIIVDGHNAYRSLVATGGLPGQPRATNIKPLKWDEKLAKAAEFDALVCASNGAPEDSRFSVGRNTHRVTFEGLDTIGANWTIPMKVWFDENRYYQYPNGPDNKTENYLQMIWADTEYLGCGYSSAYCIDRNRITSRFYVCNYGPGESKDGKAPYKAEGDWENVC